MSGAAAPAVPARLGIDGRVLEGRRSGVGRYAYELCAALDAVLPPEVEAVVYARRPVELPPGARWRLAVERSRALARLPGSVWLKARVPRLVRRDGVTVFWGAASLLPALPRGVRGVVTVYDLNHRVVPDTMPATTRAMHAAFLERDARRADAAVAISQGTATRMAALLGVRAAAVVRPAVGPAFRPPGDPEAVLRRLGVRTPYFLAVATREPRKNLPLLVRAFREQLAAGTLGAHRLVLTGAPGWREGELARELAAVPDDRVSLLGYVDDGALPALYAGATAFVFPSRYEGFGLPVLEARACGAAVIASDVPEVREAGGDEACYVPCTAEALGAALAEAAAGLVPRAAGRVDPGGWHAAARTMADVLLARDGAATPRAGGAGRGGARAPTASGAAPTP